jgi:hypothetical protein
MSKLFKLIFLALVSAFLIGCGSSGLSDGKKTSSDEKLSLEVLQSSFPDLNITALVISKTGSFISYEVTQSDIDDIAAALIKKGFEYSALVVNADIYTKDTPYGRAKVYISSVDNLMELSISIDEDVKQNSAMFQEIFPPIGLKIADIAIHLFYDDDITSGFAGYMAELEKAKFECQENTNDGYWQCKKTADGIDYEWYGEANLISYTISNSKSDIDDIVSAAEKFMSDFPTFDDGGESVIYSESSIDYNLNSQDTAKAVNATLTGVKNFDSDCKSVGYTACSYSPKYTPASKNLVDISSTVNFYFDDTTEFHFYLVGDRKIAYSEFDDIFGSFDGFDDVDFYLEYNADMKGKFDTYYNKLIDSCLFAANDCTSDSDGWECEKDDGHLSYFVSVSHNRYNSVGNSDFGAIHFGKSIQD